MTVRGCKGNYLHEYILSTKISTTTENSNKKRKTGIVNPMKTAKTHRLKGLRVERE